MSEAKLMLWAGSDAPTRDAVLTVTNEYSNDFAAYYEPGYCGCEDCHPIVGRGKTEAEAIADYWEQLEGRTI